jgi:outer membrane lipoprotein-sorting protein
MTMAPVEMSFRFTYENAAKKVHELQAGTLLYAGDQYRLTLGDLDVYCDGTSKWVYNGKVNEVTVFPVEAAVDMTDNPLAYLIYNKDEFNYRPVKQLKRQGKRALGVDLIPKDRNAAYTTVNLQVEKETFLPMQITYEMKNGQSYIIDVISIDTGIAVEPSSFAFPSHLHPRVTINDMR